MGLGTLQIHVGLEDGVERAKSKAHVAYVVSDLEMWRARLREKGIEPKDNLPLPNARAFEFRDPFGNRIELMQRA